jgi:hypothetical protein
MEAALTNLKTDGALLEALERSADHVITASELHNQRVSFIMGSVSEGNGLTRERVEQILAQQEGK